MSAHALSATIQLPILLLYTASSLLRSKNVMGDFLMKCEADACIAVFFIVLSLVARCIHCSDVRRRDLNYAANAQ